MRSDEYWEPSKSFWFRVYLLIGCILGVTFFFAGLFYGTGCPEIASRAIEVKYTDRDYTFTQLQCWNPAKWLNPKVISSDDTAQADPRDVFLGLLLLPPGWIMLLVLAGTFISVCIFGSMLWASFAQNHRVLNTCRTAQQKMTFAYFVFVLYSLLSAIFLVVRQGQLDYSGMQRKESLCSQFAQLRWGMCGFQIQELIYAILLLIVTVVSAKQSYDVVREMKQKSDNDPLV